MLNYYKTEQNKIIEIESFEPGCWINVVKPSEEELLFLHNNYNLDMSFLKASLDIEETSRIETEDDQTLIVVDVPTAEKNDGKVIYETIPLAIITDPNCLITVCTRETSVIKGFAEGTMRNVYTNLKTRFILQILYRVSTRFLFYLKQIDRMSSNIEKELHKSLKNKELIQLLDLEKSLVFFSTSLKANESTIERLQRGRFVKLYEEDEDLIEDVLIETKQAIEMSNIYSSILSGTMDAFASVISNNLNIVMKILTSITILMAVPTMIASFYGMNVTGLPVANFWFPVVISMIITGLVAVFLVKKDMF
jgi:magnesium transporter